MMPPTPANPDLDVDFSDCRLADAEIVSVRSSNGDLEVEYLDWQKCAKKLIFREAVGYESFSPERVSLSHGRMSDDDPLIARACGVAEEDEANDFVVFSFVSAWSGADVLRIAAKGCVVSN
jgi:hypothetical protein